MNKIVEENDNILEYCLILYEIGKQNSKTLDYLVKNNIVGRYVENIIRKDPRLFVDKLDVLPMSDDNEIGHEILIERTQH